MTIICHLSTSNHMHHGATWNKQGMTNTSIIFQPLSHKLPQHRCILVHYYNNDEIRSSLTCLHRYNICHTQFPPSLMAYAMMQNKVLKISWARSNGVISETASNWLIEESKHRDKVSPKLGRRSNHTEPHNVLMRAISTHLQLIGDDSLHTACNPPPPAL